MAPSIASGPLCTQDSLSKDLRSLGIQKGDTLMVHSSVKSLGWVAGGVETVIRALLDVLGEEGTLVVPTHTIDNTDPSTWEPPDYVPVPSEWWQTIRESFPAHNVHTTPSRRMGQLPEVVRTWPGALRSAHPQTSFAAVGRNAAKITEGHELDSRMGEKSPLAKLEGLQAKVLLLGVNFAKATLFHLAEYRTDYTPTIQSCFAIKVNGERKWMSVSDKKWGGETFAQLGKDFAQEKASAVVTGRVANADCFVFPVVEGLEYAVQWLNSHQDLMK